jgi:hypothetical protein
MDSTEMTGRVLFPHHLTRPFSPEHQKIFKLLDDDSKRRIAIAAPRHFGKTTIDGLFFPARQTLFMSVNYGVFISATQEKAIEDLTTLKRELTANTRIKKLFGPLKAEDRELQWASMAFETSTGVKWVAKGANQQHRGLKYMQWRPDLVIVDDFEDPEEVDNDLLRRKRKRRFYADIVHSLDVKDSRIIVIGTVLHEDSLLVELLEDPLWASDSIELCDDAYNSNWPEFMSSADIKAEADSYRDKGILDLWMREKRNKCITGETASFKPEFFRRFSEPDIQKQMSEGSISLSSAVMVDPAREVQPETAYSAIVGVSLDYTHRRILVRDVVNARLHPDEMYEEAVAMARRLRTVNIGVEDHGLHGFIRQPFEQFIHMQPGFFNLTWLKPKGKAKEERIKTLIPLYRMGLIWHSDVPSVCGVVEAQLMSFPHGKYKDVADCLAYINQMFHEVEVFLGGASPVMQVEKDGESQDLPYHMMTIEEMARYDRKHEPVIEGWRNAP